MRIGFDLRPAFKKSSRRRGIGKYTLQLARALLAEEPAHQFLFYTLPDGAPGLPEACSRHPLRHLPRPERLNWLLDLVQLPGRMRKDRLDLFQATEITSIPGDRHARVWVTVHDMIPFVYWEQIRRTAPADYRAALRRALRRLGAAERIITISEYSKADICRWAGASPARVDVVYPGRNPDFAPVDREEARRLVWSRYGIEPPFLLYVGGTDFRKNLGRLVEALDLLRREGAGLTLVLAGETFRHDLAEVRAVRKQVQRLGLDRSVAYPGYVPDRHLPALYSASECLVFPTLYEGFGQPPLEAMACGAPVLASRVTSIPEVCAEAAVYFDPERAESIAEAYFQLRPERREELRRLGLERAARFDWRRTARGYLELYDRHAS